MSLLRFSGLRHSVALHIKGTTSSLKVNTRKTSLLASTTRTAAVTLTETSCLACRLCRGPVPRNYVHHPRRYIYMSRPIACEPKTITIVEYSCERPIVKEPHAALSDVLQTRLLQLSDMFGEPVDSRQIVMTTNLSDHVVVRGIQPVSRTKSSAIKPKKSTSSSKKDNAKKTNKKTTKLKNTTGSLKKTSKQKTTTGTSKKNAPSGKGTTPAVKSKSEQLKTKNKTSRTKVEKSGADAKGKSAKDKVKQRKTSGADSSNKMLDFLDKRSGKSTTSTKNPPSKNVLRLKRLDGEKSQIGAGAKGVRNKDHGAKLAKISAATSPSSLPASSSSLPSFSSSTSSSSPHSSPPSTSSSTEQYSLPHPGPTTASSQQLHNLRLAFGDAIASPDLGDHIHSVHKQNPIGGRTQSTGQSLQQKFQESHLARTETRLPAASGIPQVTYDFDEKNTLDHPELALDSMLDFDAQASNAPESRLQNKSRNERPPKHKRTTRKQFSEDPELYLRPFLDACVYSGKTVTAQAMLFAFEKLNSGVSVDDYNILIQAYARKGKWDEVRHLLARMASKSVTSNRQTYAAAFECLARCPDPDLDLVTKGLKQMERESVSLDEVLTVGSFSGEGRQLVIDLVQKVLLDYKPPPPSERSRCTTNIVEDLYAGSCESSPEGARNMSFSELFDKEDLERRFQQQWAMELAETVAVTSIQETGNPDAATVQRRQLLDQHKVQWRISLKKALENEKTRQKYKIRNPNLGSICYYPFLDLLQPDEYASLMLQALSNLASTMEGSMTVVLARDLGSRVYRKYSIRAKLQQGNAEQIKELYKTYVQKSVEEQDSQFQLPREYFQQLEDDMLGSSSLDKGFQAKAWPPVMIIGIGTLLADIMLREIKIDSNMHNSKQEKQWIPALYHMYTYRSFKHVGFIKPHPTLVDLIQTAKDPILEFDSNMLPMVTPPLPWTSVRFGTYPLSSTKIMRCKDGAQQHQQLLEKTKSAELYPILDALNQLSAVPWIINKSVLDTVVSVFRNNGSKELDIPQPSSAYPLPQRITSDMSREEQAHIHRERAASRKLQAEMHSLRMDMLYKLSIADKFRDEIFWFPHNMDFRGRVYPCPPHFNHFGNDVTRSLLLFARGRPLTEEGFRWLKIHLVNLTGHKKRCSVDERLQYAHEVMPEIIDSADRPLDGNGWWRGSDEPWQTLAACMEVTKAIRSDDPAKFVSHLPIHQDGSCNGLQHYAALGRDLIGAQQVNLHPYDVPQDVYSGVAQMVEELRKQDADKGNKTAQALEGHIKRNVVKQTVMTVVYGVTSYGGRRQILKQLRDKDDLTHDDKWYGAGYLTLKVFQSLRKMFTKTREIQDYLTESAWLISKAGETVEWVTPLGLPIVQPYHKKSLKLVSHSGHNIYHLDKHSQSERPDTMKQKNAFPPNFIHSLDSTHMMLTSLYSQRAGITFASVHDCFWTHASSVDHMNKICRNQFVKLHKEPILDNLADFMIDRYGQLDIQQTSKLKRGSRNMEIIEDYVKNVPEKGDFDLDNVLRSTYFFS